MSLDPRPTRTAAFRTGSMNRCIGGHPPRVFASGWSRGQATWSGAGHA